MTVEMSVGDILADVYCEPLDSAALDLKVSSIEFSSRDVSAGALFFCVPGTAADGHDYAADAVNRGAAALVVERPLDVDAPQFLVYDARKALALGSARFFGNPSESLRLVGVTGTNGKTTTTFLVEHMARVAGEQAGLMGTVECHIADEVRPSLHTTPESRDLQMLLRDMVDAGVGVAALEVSSHAIDLGRILGTKFAVAAFTNLTQDHLDYHKTMENYFLAKAALFTDAPVDKCVICTDGEYGRRLAELCRAVGREPITVGSSFDANVRLVDAQFAPHSTKLSIDMDGTKVDIRDHSRVLEINPTTLKLEWSFKGSDLKEGMMSIVENTTFYSQLISAAQRLPNGNTLITEGCFCRLFEVTPEKEIVWEYRAPFDEVSHPMIYRAYRYPYSYVPQLEEPTEVPVERINNMTFRMPGAAEGMLDNITEVPEALGYTSAMAACVTEDETGDDDATGAKF